MPEINYSSKSTCKGKAYICVYNFDAEFVKKDSFQCQFLEGKASGGFGALIFVDYTETPVGPYQEVMFIPGKYEVGGESRYVATKCYVSKPEAIDANGDGFFGPKELAAFNVSMVDNSTIHLSVTKGRSKVLALEIGTWDAISLPASSSIISFPFMQLLNGQERLLWKYEARSAMNIAHLSSVQVRPAYFPDIAKFSPIVTLCLNNFELSFEPEKEKK